MISKEKAIELVEKNFKMSLEEVEEHFKDFLEDEYEESSPHPRAGFMVFSMFMDYMGTDEYSWDGSPYGTPMWVQRLCWHLNVVRKSLFN